MARWTQRLQGENHAYEERHRTELTEASEEGRSLVAKAAQMDTRELHRARRDYDENDRGCTKNSIGKATEARLSTLVAMLSLLRGSRTGRLHAEGIHHGAYVHRPNRTELTEASEEGRSSGAKSFFFGHRGFSHTGPRLRGRGIH